MDSKINPAALGIRVNTPFVTPTVENIFFVETKGR